MMEGRGDLIDGRFVAPSGEVLRSRNPARGHLVVLETRVSVAHMEAACEAAAAAWPAWAALSLEERREHLWRLREALRARSEGLADAIVLETGKLRSEGRAEVASLLSRFDLVLAQVKQDLREGPLPGFPNESLRWHPQGVVGVIGPYNFPMHLCHAHVVPAALLGNTVVIKPSDVTPLCGQRYAEAVLDADLPPGVINLVQGTAAGGAALVAHAAVRGICFTGSWEVGHRIQQAALDRPELLLALELGGRNAAIVLEDCDLRQTLHEAVVGGYLTTGQRCTCTNRVLVQRSIKDRVIDGLRDLVSRLRFGDPEDPSSFAGPLASQRALDTYEAAIRAGEARGAEPLVEHRRLAGGSFCTPSMHLVPEDRQEIEGYTDVEVFGPNLAIEVIDDLDHAVALMKESPYGLANAVFTSSTSAFERLYREVHAGVWNLNRTTNKASPRLPFGGVGRSGNQRPAGSFAPRNVVYAASLQHNLPGSLGEPHPMLLNHLPRPDLERLERQHAGEEACEAARDTLGLVRPMAVHGPLGGALPQSSHWLERFYAGDRFAREKKPGVFDHQRSGGPWFVSVDANPLSVLDAMSQTATVCGGFNEDPVVEAYLRGEFGETPLVVRDTTLEPCPEVEAFAAQLRALVPGLEHVTFASSGAEANEKALALCRLQRPEAKRVLAFEGSFHGRTILALHATWNPVKRAPFEIEGYEADFAPFPIWSTPMEPEPAVPEGFLELVAQGALDELCARFDHREQDPLLAAEVETLRTVHAFLGRGQHFACIIEPMQSEGGDRYATARFYRALRLLTRHHGVPLCFDEVQTGFGLGGPFAWHQGFGLTTASGEPDGPDCLTFAKRAQVGVCMSRFPDPEPTPVERVSLIRGRLHAEMMTSGQDAARIEGLVRPRLLELARRYPQLVSNARARGFAIAFDLPSAEDLNAFISQRFWRGAIVFAAGQRTVRYRLSSSWREADIDLLFSTMRRSLSWLDANPGRQPPAWQDQPHHRDTPPSMPPLPDNYRVRVASGDEGEAMLDDIMALEARLYEPARRDPREKLAQACGPDGVVVVVEHQDPASGEWKAVGSALGCPIEAISTTIDGPGEGPMRGLNNTLYSLALSVDPAHQGVGLGHTLKCAQLRAAAAKRNPDGTPRYAFVTGRNRLGNASAMVRLNRRLGANVVAVYDHQYGDPQGRALYYRIPLGPLRPVRPRPDDVLASPGRMDDGLVRPLGHVAPSLRQAETQGALAGPTINKITICNYITPAIVRAVEYITALVPRLPHLYLTSSRDETFDKSLRVLKYARQGARVAIGLEGGYLGHTTAAARSLSDPAVHRGGPGHFDEWQRIPHPAEVGSEAAIDALRATIAAVGGAQNVLGLWLEVVQERTGRVVPEEFWARLAAVRDELGVPFVLVENASASWRSGLGPFAMSALNVVPDIMTWWGGGQVGFLHVSSRWFVGKPLTFVSTWDGDELGMVRLHHQLRAVRALELAPALDAMSRLCADLSRRGISARGLGLYRVFSPGAEHAERFAQKLADAGVQLRRLPNARFAAAPALDVAEEAIAQLSEALADWSL